MSRRSVLAFAVSTLFAVGHTWPLATDLNGLSRHDNADTTLNTWAVAWIAHALPRHPLAVFDAPIFHPERRTLAYSEPLLVPGAMAVPLRAANLSATATYNVLVILGFAASMWAMWRVVAHWTDDEWAGAVAGAAFAFNAHLLTRVAHLQAIHAEAVPLVLFALDRVVRVARVRDGLLLGLGLMLVGLTSIYQLAFAAGAIVAALVATAFAWRARAARTLAAASAGVAVGVAGLSPLLWQYLAVSQAWGLSRTIDDAASYAATWQSYLAATGRLHVAWWSAPYASTVTALFPGVAVTLLAVVGLARAREHGARRAMLAGIGVAGLLMSLGPSTPLYRWLFDLVPLLRATRVSARWGVLVLTALAALAGLGVAELRRRRQGRMGAVISIAALAAVTLEALRAPMAFTPTPSIAPIYARLAAIPEAVLLEFPTFPRQQANLNAPYMLAQTAHFHPIVAGYSGVSTAGFDERLADLVTFPADRSRRRIDEIGVTHVVVHMDAVRGAVGQAAIDALDAVPWLTRELEDAGTRVFRVRRDPASASPR
jgi:hypothetical protein